MPTITIRLSATEKAELESAARRSKHSLSEYVRQTLALREEDQDALGRIGALEEQVRAITRAANRGHGHIPEF